VRRRVMSGRGRRVGKRGHMRECEGRGIGFIGIWIYIRKQVDAAGAGRLEGWGHLGGGLGVMDGGII